MVYIIYFVIWFIALVFFKFNPIIIGLGIVFLIALSAGITNAKRDMYLADKYDEEKRGKH